GSSLADVGCSTSPSQTATPAASTPTGRPVDAIDKTQLSTNPSFVRALQAATNINSRRTIVGGPECPPTPPPSASRPAAAAARAEGILLGPWRLVQLIAEG